MASKLSFESFQSAGRFLETYGRPLDVARFRFHFAGGDRQVVLDELATFQNPDGGFGHALEPDLRCPQSSPLATSHAFQVLRELDTSPQQPEVATLVQPTIAYLLATCDRGLLTWHNLPNGVDAYPHAPWWNGAGREASLSHFELNPTAELLGYLVEYAPTVAAELIQALWQKIIATLTGLEKTVMHDFLCCKRLIETPGLPEQWKKALFNELSRLLPTTVSTNPEQWVGYSLRPLWVAGRPDSPFYPLLRDAVEQNLDYDIATQQEDGAWPVNWSWDGLFPDAWGRAKLDWQAAFCVDRLLWFKNFGRIDRY